MTKQKCQEANIGGIEYPGKYDGVWDWYCPIRDCKVCRWILDKNNRRVKEDPMAYDNLCDGCKVPDEQ